MKIRPGLAIRLGLRFGIGRFKVRTWDRSGIGLGPFLRYWVRVGMHKKGFDYFQEWCMGGEGKGKWGGGGYIPNGSLSFQTCNFLAFRLKAIRSQQIGPKPFFASFTN